MRALLLAAVAVALSPQPAAARRAPAPRSADFAECLAAIDTEAMTSSQRLICATREMHRADRQLNDTYQALLLRHRPAERHALRVRERAWIAHRRDACALARQAADPSQDYNRMLCLVRETDAQTGRLRAMR